jgi:hypothetical protein
VIVVKQQIVPAAAQPVRRAGGMTARRRAVAVGVEEVYDGICPVPSDTIPMQLSG